MDNVGDVSYFKTLGYRQRALTLGSEYDRLNKVFEDFVASIGPGPTTPQFARLELLRREASEFLRHIPAKKVELFEEECAYLSGDDCIVLLTNEETPAVIRPQFARTLCNGEQSAKPGRRLVWFRRENLFVVQLWNLHVPYNRNPASQDRYAKDMPKRYLDFANMTAAELEAIENFVPPPEN